VVRRAKARPAAADAVVAAASRPLANAARPQATGAQLAALARFDMRFVFRSPAFFVLLAIGVFNAWGSAWFTAELYGTRATSRHAADGAGAAGFVHDHPDDHRGVLRR
jgi:hypothetical protein